MYSICEGTMPMLDKVMSITKGATDGISSVSQQANTSVRHNSSPFCLNYAVITMLLLLFFSVAFGETSLSHVLYSLGCWELRVLRARLDMELVLAMVLDLVCHIYSFFSIFCQIIYLPSLSDFYSIRCFLWFFSQLYIA